MFRWFPTPTYKNCGGAELDCSLGDKVPADVMDQYFAEHDMNLYAAKQMDTKEEIDSAKKEADRILFTKLKKLSPSGLSLYGKLYRLGALAVFWRP